ncbi:MAG: MBL fold metallo-hydrolase [Clostridia bacterium]|nr:MBL fold metallo-hydrolase [Clostridia bacterium]
MIIKRISPIGFASNCYAVSADGKDALVIDPSQERVAGKLKEMRFTAKHVLLTHCHFDHTMGTPVLQSQGAKVWCGEKEKPLFGSEVDLYDYFGAPYVPFEIEETLADGQQINLCGLKVTLLHTPGHTSGSVCYLIEDGAEKALFTGDTLFCGSIGRTDFFTGSIRDMRASLRRLKELSGNMPVYPGHEEETTLAAERDSNLYMREA